MQCHACYGGTDAKAEAKLLQRQTSHVISGTPGRVLDMMRRDLLRPKGVRMFVIDEADEMLEAGLKKQIIEVFRRLTSETQVVLVSATLPPEILEMAEQFMTEPLRILVKK